MSRCCDLCIPSGRYSPDLNPIEKAFAWVKAYVKRVQPQSDAAVVAAIFQGLEDMPAKAAAGYFRSCFWTGAKDSATLLAEARVADEQSAFVMMLVVAVVVITA